MPERRQQKYMLERKTEFSQLAGNADIIEKIAYDIKHKEFPDFVILYGNEGIGKTSLAEIIALNILNPNKEERLKLINNQQIVGLRRSSMSLENSLALIQEIVADLKSSISKSKVFILDEAQDMTNLCQNALLTDLEYIPEGKHVIMCTTDIGRLNKTLQSRAYIIRLKDPSQEEMRILLKNEMLKRNLRSHKEQLLVELIIKQYKRPRACLKVIEAMGRDKVLSLQNFKLYVDYEDTIIYKELLLCLEKSLHLGLMKANSVESLDNLADYTEAVLVCDIEQSVKYNNAQLKEVFEKVPQEKLYKFLYKLLEPGHTDNRKAIKYALLSASGMFSKTNSKMAEDMFTAENSGVKEVKRISSEMYLNKTEKRVQGLAELISSSAEVTDE